MRTLTIQDALTTHEKALADHYLYVIEAEGTALYVGLSDNPLQRLLELV